MNVQKRKWLVRDKVRSFVSIFGSVTVILQKGSFWSFISFHKSISETGKFFGCSCQFASEGKWRIYCSQSNYESWGMTAPFLPSSSEKFGRWQRWWTFATFATTMKMVILSILLAEDNFHQIWPDESGILTDSSEWHLCPMSIIFMKWYDILIWISIGASYYFIINREFKEASSPTCF